MPAPARSPRSGASDASPHDEPTGRATKGRAPHRRDESARAAVLHAADDLLVERGFNGVTIEGIAQRAGVAKQTIYRWWPSKVEILLDTLINDAARELAVPETGAAPVGLRRYLRNLARFLDQDDAGKVLLALLGATQHDADIAAGFTERFMAPQRAAERALISRGVAAGEFPRETDPDDTLDALIGPIYLRALGGRRVTHPFIDGLLARTLGIESPRTR